MVRHSDVPSRPPKPLRGGTRSRHGLRLLPVAAVASGASVGCGERARNPAGPESAALAGSQPAAAVSGTPPTDAADGPPEPAAVAAGIDGLGCVVHYRAAAGGYVSQEFGLRFRRAARRGARRAWVLTYEVMGAVSRPREDGTVETLPPVLGVRAVCVLPGTGRARDETVARLEAVLEERGLRGRPETSASVPLERAVRYAWAGLRGALGRLGPRPLSARECLERNRHNECTAWSVEPIHVVAPGTPITVTCPAGFDFEYSSGNCVRTGFDPVAPVWPGNSGGASPPPPPPPEPPACTDDQIAIADEYDDPAAWPCTMFTHSMTPGTGTHGHKTGYLTDSYISGSGNVLNDVAARGVSGAVITSDWRCPEGNSLVGAKGLTHVHGRAGDFWAPGFLDEADGANATIEEEAAARKLHGEFAKAAQAAGGRFSAFGQDDTHKDHIHIFW